MAHKHSLNICSNWSTFESTPVSTHWSTSESTQVSASLSVGSIIMDIGLHTGLPKAGPCRNVLEKGSAQAIHLVCVLGLKVSRRLELVSCWGQVKVRWSATWAGS